MLAGGVDHQRVGRRLQVATHFLHLAVLHQQVRALHLAGGAAGPDRGVLHQHGLCGGGGIQSVLAKRRGARNERERIDGLRRGRLRHFGGLGIGRLRNLATRQRERNRSAIAGFGGALHTVTGHHGGAAQQAIHAEGFTLQREAHAIQIEVHALGRVLHRLGCLGRFGRLGWRVGLLGFGVRRGLHGLRGRGRWWLALEGDALGVGVDGAGQFHIRRLQREGPGQRELHRLVVQVWRAGHPGAHHVRLLAEQRAVGDKQVRHAAAFQRAGDAGQTKLLRGARGQARQQLVLAQPLVHGATRARGQVAAVLHAMRADAHIHARIKQLLGVARRQCPGGQFAQAHRVVLARVGHVGRLREFHRHHHGHLRVGHFLQAAELHAVAQHARLHAEFACHAGGAQQILLVAHVEHRHVTALHQRRERLQCGRGFGCIVALRMRGPHLLALRMPVRVVQRLPHQRHRTHECGGVARILRAIVAHVREGDHLTGRGHDRLGLAVFVCKQHHRALAAEDAGVRMHGGQREAKVTQLLACGCGHRRKIGHAHLRCHLAVPVRAGVVGHGARNRRAVHQQTRVDQAGIDGLAARVVHGRASRSLHLARLAHGGDPAVLKQDRAVLDALARLHHDGGVLDQVAAQISRAHGHGRRRLPEGTSHEADKSGQAR